MGDQEFDLEPMETFIKMQVAVLSRQQINGTGVWERRLV